VVVSRPFIIRLVEEGKLACRLAGTHRRIPIADLLALKEANRAERRAIAAELTADLLLRILLAPLANSTQPTVV
jgi:excisionase family DNA binding protein